jgi:hypothetical protein
MINQDNITDFIKYAFRIRKKQEAPGSLLEAWRNVPPHEIGPRLEQLFESWNFTTQQKNDVVQDFFRYQKVVNQGTVKSTNNYKSSEPTLPNSGKGDKKKWGKLSRLVYPLILCFTIALLYFAKKYFDYDKLHYVYTLTERVAIRNESREQIGSMDLNPQSNSKSFQRLLAADNEIYPKAIDSSDKLYDHRKVYIKPITFWEFLQDKPNIYGYVNAKFVVDSKEEFETYKRLFGQLLPADNKKLQLKHRRIVAQSISFDKSLKNYYLLSPCIESSERIRKYNSGILVHEIIPDNKYEIIAKLSDGFYYQFSGDFVSNSYARPRRIGYVAKPNREDECLQGELFFKYDAKNNKFLLRNCKGQSLDFEAILSTEGSILYFTKKEPQINPFEPIEEMAEDALDIFDSVKDVINGLIQ